MLDNLSIKNLSMMITAICGLVVFGITGYVFLLENINLDYKIYAVLLLLGLVILYFTISFLLEKYVFKKLRIIYKFISKSKATGGSMNSDMKSLSIDKVNTDVINWASDTEKRIESLQTLAEYRKNFVGNVSHELKTPIFSLQGYLYTLLDGGIYDESINLKYIEKAAQNADRLQHIVEDLESIGQMESGKMNLEMATFDIKELIYEVYLDHKRQAEKAKIKLNIGYSTDFPMMVIADKEAIRQVLNNLITNSIKYGEEAGTTNVNLFNIDKTILVEVSDDGMGIEEKHIEHLFDRFYRVDTNRSRAQGGSGLGLSIVKHIVEAHGQTITVQSTVSEGSTFGFTLEKSKTV